MRRPLIQQGRNTNLGFQSPSDSLMAYFTANRPALPSYAPHCAEPLFAFENTAAIAAALGFESTPSDKMQFYPAGPLPGQHPKVFLQWGWGVQGNKVAALEIGDAGYIVSLHFTKTEPRPHHPWHLDVVEIDDGKRDRAGNAITYHMPCDEPEYRPHIDTLLQGIAATVALLNRDEWRLAQERFHGAIRPVLQDLDAISDQLDADHAATGWRPVPNRV